jgi:hypothetical protein
MGFRDKVEQTKGTVQKQSNEPRFGGTRASAPRNKRLFESFGEYDFEVLKYSRVNQYSIFELKVLWAKEGSVLTAGEVCSHMINRQPPPQFGGTELAFKDLQSIIYPLLGVDLTDEEAYEAALVVEGTDDIPNELDGFGTLYGEPVVGMRVHSRVYEYTNKNGAQKPRTNFKPYTAEAA